MLLKFCKKLNQENADRIREINKKIITLQKLQDASFLKEDLEQKTPVWKSENPYVEFLLDEEIGPILSDSKYVMGRTTDNKIFFNKEERNMEKISFAIMMSKRAYPSPSFIYVSATIENLILHTKDICIDPVSGGSGSNIYAIAIYFYNKLDAYKKIQNCLIKNEKRLKEQISNSYIKDLIKLFAASSKRKNVKDFCIPEEYASKEECIINVSSIKNKAIAIVDYSYYVKGHFIKNVEICLLIEENNIFSYYVIPRYDTEINENQELLDFINNNTNKWLKDLEEMASFGYAIGKKLKTKLLISNI